MDRPGDTVTTHVGRISSHSEGGGSAEPAGRVLALQPSSRVSAGLASRAATVFAEAMPGGHSIVDAFLPAAQVPVEGTSSSIAAVQVAVERLPYQGAGSDSLQVAVEGVPHSIVASLVGADASFQCGKAA